MCESLWAVLINERVDHRLVGDVVVVRLERRYFVSLILSVQIFSHFFLNIFPHIVFKGYKKNFWIKIKHGSFMAIGIEKEIIQKFRRVQTVQLSLD